MSICAGMTALLRRRTKAAGIEHDDVSFGSRRRTGRPHAAAGPPGPSARDGTGPGHATHREAEARQDSVSGVESSL